MVDLLTVFADASNALHFLALSIQTLKTASQYHKAADRALTGLIEFRYIITNHTKLNIILDQALAKSVFIDKVGANDARHIGKTRRDLLLSVLS